ncbi:rRNA-processing protein bfr2 [Serendipita sp. 399]|nr:rRNA-processing protein bfr2 [Serendipita sp. 399]
MKPVTDLIQEALADHPRAVGRTRLRRGPPRMDASDDRLQVDVEGKPLQAEEIELFDDADFYQQLLREVIEGKAVNGNTLVLSVARSPPLTFIRFVSSGYDENDGTGHRPKKLKKQVDTRASKGRKLRYEVHEKIQNFMVPVPTIIDGWHEEKIDELFASLLGRSATTTMEAETDIRSKLGRDGFRIFG